MILSVRLIMYNLLFDYGFWPDRPYKDHPAYDIVIQGLGELMGIAGEVGQTSS